MFSSRHLDRERQYESSRAKYKPATFFLGDYPGYNLDEDNAKRAAIQNWRREVKTWFTRDEVLEEAGFQDLYSWVLLLEFTWRKLQNTMEEWKMLGGRL
jgi:hypothetical protein